MFPTADEIATAIIMAARFQAEEPIAVARGNASRARHVAMAALMEAFPDARRTAMARCVGYRNPQNGWSQTSQAMGLRWWDDDQVNEIVGALVADQFDDEGEDAVAVPSTPSRPVPTELPDAIRFDQQERRLISRMWRDGANEVSIGAALGADADTIRIFAEANPLACPPREDRP